MVESLPFLIPLFTFAFLLALGMPVAFGIGIAGIVGIYMTSGMGAAVGVLANTPFQQSANFVFTTIPMFVLMAEIAKQSQITERLFTLTERFVGHFKGGLGIATIFASALLAAISGDSTASAAAMASTAAESMERRGYSRKLAMGIVTTAGTISIMIPPSLGLIVYGVLTETSIGYLFIAGIVPGILTTAAYATQTYLWAVRKPEAAPSSERTGWALRLRSLTYLSPVLFIITIVVGGIYLGILTPTEAGGAGAFSTLLVALWYGKSYRDIFDESFTRSVRLSVMVLIIIITAHIFGFYLATSGISRSILSFITYMNPPNFMVMLLLLFPYLFLGFFMSNLAILVIMLPITFPILNHLGYDPIWQGIVITKLAEVGLVSPPYGMNVFVAAGARGISPEEVFEGVMPFLISDALVIALLIAFPEISTFLTDYLTQ